MLVYNTVEVKRDNISTLQLAQKINLIYVFFFYRNLSYNKLTSIDPTAFTELPKLLEV